jgi:hypothetical protein
VRWTRCQRIGLAVRSRVGRESWTENFQIYFWLNWRGSKLLNVGMKSLLPIVFSVTGFAVTVPSLDAQDTKASAGAMLVVKADQPGAVINRNIYGQFSEHLGHCIYEGVWVGENSPIPNTRDIRNDVVAALKKN